MPRLKTALCHVCRNCEFVWEVDKGNNCPDCATPIMQQEDRSKFTQDDFNFLHELEKGV